MLEKKPVAKLVVRSEPSGAKVYLNGKYMGTTPLEKEFDKEISCEMKLEKDRYYEERKWIEVKLGERKG